MSTRIEHSDRWLIFEQQAADDDGILREELARRASAEIPDTTSFDPLDELIFQEGLRKVLQSGKTLFAKRNTCRALCGLPPLDPMQNDGDVIDCQILKEMMESSDPNAVSLVLMVEDKAAEYDQWRKRLVAEGRNTPGKKRETVFPREVMNEGAIRSGRRNKERERFALKQNDITPDSSD